MTWTINFFLLVFVTAVVAGLGWGLGNILASKLANIGANRPMRIQS